MEGDNQDRDSKQAGKILNVGYCGKMNTPYFVVVLPARTVRTPPFILQTSVGVTVHRFSLRRSSLVTTRV